MKVLTSQADLDPKDRISYEMLSWCQEHEGIVVMNSGLILTTDIASRTVQNCKGVMINKGLRPGRVMQVTQELITVVLGNIDQDAFNQQQDGQVAAEIEVSKQQKRLRILIQEAVSAEVSDLHIEVREKMARIRFRKHGELYLHAEWFPKIAREIASVAFNKETDYATSHFNPLVPQNASMPMEIDGQELRLRLASVPAHGGFDVVMRILGATQEQTKVPSLQELGYTDDQVKLITRASKLPHGAILMAGPTGSGKTTTLASCMSMVELDRKVYTIEDPVEKYIENATQIPVNTDKEDRSFASFGRASLRMDPDVIVLGEMRDEDTAAVMVRAAITGHLVYSTIHTNSATNIITRLSDLGISNILLSDGSLLKCLMYQRLIVTLCPQCAVSIKDSAAHAKQLPRWQDFFKDKINNIRVRNEKPCEACRHLGIQGRKVVAEVVWIDDKGREFIQKGDTYNWEKYLKSQGWRDHRDQAIYLVSEGLVDPIDAEKVIGEISNTFSTDTFNYTRFAQGEN
jgi:general secretion pathway protein E